MNSNNNIVYDPSTPEVLIDSLKKWLTTKIELAKKLYFNTDPCSFNDEINRDMLSIRIFELEKVRENLECLNLVDLRMLKNFMVLDNYVTERGVPGNGGNRNA